jgi:hypothetical protein
LNKAREVSFRSDFIKDGTDRQLDMHVIRNGIPYNGYSQFILAYPGEIPDALHKAYVRMNELNEKGPRKKYLKERKKEAELVLGSGQTVGDANEKKDPK